MSRHSCCSPAVDASWLYTDTIPSAVSLTRIELQAAEVPNVGTGGDSPVPPGDVHPIPVPTSPAGAR